MTHNKLQNPYIGPRYFQEEEKDYFFGREEESKILMGLVLARRVVLLFAKSGVGKSSLLRAGLTPLLTETKTVGRGRRRHTQPAKMKVLPITSVGRGIRLDDTVTINNIFVYSALLTLRPDDSPAQLADLSLSDALTDQIDGPDRPTLLIFDQFEELFSRHVDYWSHREAFFHQVNQAMSDQPNLHVLFAMREDYIAELTPYADLLPDRLQSRLRLERLNPLAALKAVTKPAEQAGRSFAEGVAEELVDNLWGGTPPSGRPPTPAEASRLTATKRRGAYVEPVHLQLVCQQLWAGLPAERQIIQTADLQKFGDVDEALTRFYEDTLHQVLSEIELSERQVRTWFSEQLITPARTKGLVYLDEQQQETAGLPNLAVDILAEAWLIRADIRGEDTWYELAHDRLVEPILAANREWFAEALQRDPLLQAAQAWAEAGKPTNMLYRDEQLQAAEYETETAETVVGEFMEASQQAQREREFVVTRARERRTRWFAGLLGVLLVVAVGATMYAVYQRFQAEIARDLAEQKRVAAVTSEAKAEVARVTAVFEANRAGTAEAKAEIERQNAVEARATLAQNLEDILATQTRIAQNLIISPEIVPTINDTVIPPSITATPTPIPNPVATQLFEVNSTQTAIAQTITATPTPISNPIATQLFEVNSTQTAIAQMSTNTPDPTEAVRIENYYEPNDLRENAYYIKHEEIQEHTLGNGDNEDWIMFTLDTRSGVEIVTEGDKIGVELTLYKGLQKIKYNHNPMSFFQEIKLFCDSSDLEAGVYHLHVVPFSKNFHFVYKIKLKITTCG